MRGVIFVEITYKKLSEIHPYEKNPRVNDNAVDAVEESISQYGFQNPIIIDKKGEIIAGHTRYKAAKNMGLAEVPCVVAKNLSDAQARAYRIADNKTSDFSIWDNKLLLKELDELQEIDIDLFTGFDDSDSLFEDVLDEKEKGAVCENDYGCIYEVTFQSEEENKIEQIKEAWEKISNGEFADS